METAENEVRIQVRDGEKRESANFELRTTKTAKLRRNFGGGKLGGAPAPLDPPTPVKNWRGGGYRNWH